MIGLLKKLFGGKPAETTAEAPYKAEAAPAVEVAPAVEAAPAPAVEVVDVVVSSSSTATLVKQAPAKKPAPKKQQPAKKPAAPKTATAKAPPKPKAKPTA